MFSVSPLQSRVVGVLQPVGDHGAAVSTRLQRDRRRVKEPPWGQRRFAPEELACGAKGEGVSSRLGGRLNQAYRESGRALAMPCNGRNAGLLTRHAALSAVEMSPSSDSKAGTTPLEGNVAHTRRGHQRNYPKIGGYQPKNWLSVHVFLTRARQPNV